MSMIAAVSGELAGRESGAALVRVGGVVLRVHVPAHDLAALTGPQVELFTHLIVREDDLALYGFATEEGRTLFEALLEVSQVGPKAALAVLSVLSPPDLAAAIVAGDGAAIARAHGVGKRTAERIILELRDKLAEGLGPLAAAPGAPAAGSAGADPALAFLLGLGFSAMEARQALAGGDAGSPTEERVRDALRRLGR
jgi:Holliday junction DNA helicase RuvA